MRKVKASFKDIPTYYRYQRVFYNKNTGAISNATNDKETVGGYLYFISYKVSDEEKREITERHSNVVWLKSRKEYAPEIVNDVLFVADKVLDVGGEM